MSDRRYRSPTRTRAYSLAHTMTADMHLAPQLTLGAQLERDRLQHRAIRLQAVVGVLRGRAAEARASGERPARGLTAALGEFEQELRAVRRLLHATQERSR
jgi:hypothetical protein